MRTWLGHAFSDIWYAGETSGMSDVCTLPVSSLTEPSASGLLSDTGPRSPLQTLDNI